MLAQRVPIPGFLDGVEPVGFREMIPDGVQRQPLRQRQRFQAQPAGVEPRDGVAHGCDGHGQEIDVDVLRPEVPRQLVGVAPVGRAGDGAHQPAAEFAEFRPARFDERARSEAGMARAQFPPGGGVWRRGVQQVIPVSQERRQVRLRPAQHRMVRPQPRRPFGVVQFPEPPGRRGGEQEGLVQNVEEGVLGNAARQDGLHGPLGAGHVVVVAFVEKPFEGVHRRAVVGPFVGDVDDAVGRDFVEHALDAGALRQRGQDGPHDAQGDERVAPEIGQEVPRTRQEFFPVGQKLEVADRLREMRILRSQFPAAIIHQFGERHGRERREVGRGADEQAQRGAGGRARAREPEVLVGCMDVCRVVAGELQAIVVPPVQRPLGERGLAEAIQDGADDVAAIGQIPQGESQPGFERGNLAGPEEVFQPVFILAVGIDAEARHERVVEQDGRRWDGNLGLVRNQRELHAALPNRVGKGTEFAFQRPAGGLRGFEAQRRFSGRHGHHHAAARRADGNLHVRGDLGLDVSHQDVFKIALQLANRQHGHGVSLLRAVAGRFSVPVWIAPTAPSKRFSSPSRRAAAGAKGVRWENRIGVGWAAVNRRGAGGA